MQIDHIAFTTRQLALFPEIARERTKHASDRREAVVRHLLRDDDNGMLLAHLSAILSSYQVEAMAQTAAGRAYAESDTEEEAADHFADWLEGLAREHMMD